MRGINAVPLRSHLSIIERIRRIPFDGRSSYSDLKNCTPMVHDVSVGLLSNKVVRGFSKSITILPSSIVDGTSSLYNAVVRRGPFSGDGTCNVFVVGVPHVTISYVYADNAKCVEDIVEPDIEKSLERFGPDQLEILRITQPFDDYMPTHLRLTYVEFNTYRRYRKLYPGRPLASADALNNRRYPPDPINIDNTYFDALTDTHFEPVPVPWTLPPESTDPPIYSCCSFDLPRCPKCCGNYTLMKNLRGEMVCKETTENKAAIKACKDAKNDPCSTEEQEQYYAYARCNKTTDVLREYMVDHANLFTCVSPDFIRQNDTCSGDLIYDPTIGMCLDKNQNRLNSRPIDLILWDFQGNVMFGQNFPHVGGTIFTVLVFGDRDISATGVLKGAGQVFEEFIDDSKKFRKARFRTPDPGLNLLDGSDFYDVVSARA